MVLALNAVADGAAMVTENLFEARFMFVDELARLGADIRTDGHHAVVRGRRAAVRGAGAGHRHPGRGRPGRGGAGRRRRHHGQRRRATSTAATRGSTPQLRALGADIVREPDLDDYGT